MTRAQLPDRRRNVTVPARFGDFDLKVTVGFDHRLRPREAFADGPKMGTALAHIVADACVVVSLALQHGARPADLAKSLGRIPEPHRGEDAEGPASALGAIVEAIVAADPGVEITPERDRTELLRRAGEALRSLLRADIECAAGGPFGAPAPASVAPDEFGPMAQIADLVREIQAAAPPATRDGPAWLDRTIEDPSWLADRGDAT